MREMRALAGGLTALICLCACVPQVEYQSKQESAPPSSRPAVGVQSTRDWLQSLRPEVSELLKSLPEDAEPDGMPLLRRGGKLFYWGIDEDLPKDPFEWVRDGWGQPVVFLRAEGESDDWCLASAGPDRAWTTDGISFVTKRIPPVLSEIEFVERAPHYYGEEETAHRCVLGDDIVLHSTGLFFRSYAYSIPGARVAVASLLGQLQGSKSASIPPTPELADELKDLTPEERELSSAFLRSHEAGFALSEDTWSHECKRRDGLLPRLYLWNEKLADRATPFVWIEPRDDGWALDWDVDALFGAIEEGGVKVGTGKPGE